VGFLLVLHCDDRMAGNYRETAGGNSNNGLKTNGNGFL